EIVIGYNATGIGSNSVVLGNDSITTTALKGNVGIGTTVPDQALDVIGTIQASNLLGGAVNLTTDASGNIIRDPSDANLKENIVGIEDALETVLALRGVRYEWQDKNRFGDQIEIGFIAQELQEVVPEIVRTGGEYLSINTRNITALNVEAIKELNLKIEYLEAENIPQEDAGILVIITNWFESIGIYLSESLARFNNLAAAAFTVGSEAKPSGITIYDKSTGEPYCLEIDNGAMVNTPGTCEELAQDNVNVQAPTLTLLGNNPAEIEIGSTYSDLGVTAKNADGDDISYNVSIDGVEVSNGDIVTIDTTTDATFEIVYTATDNGETVNVTREVIVGTGVSADDTHTLTVILNGDATIDTLIGEPYVDQGAEALDEDGNALTLTTTLNGTATTDITADLDTSTTTTHTIEYTADYTDTDGNIQTATSIRTVHVVEPTPDTNAPVITLTGDEIIEIEVGQVYSDAGATAEDDVDGTVDVVAYLDGVEITDWSVINTDAVTSYSIEYRAIDSAGNENTDTVFRTVNVIAAPEPVDTTAPVIALIGDAEITLTVGDSYEELGATASDDVDGDITADITTTDTVDTTTVGEYIITYTVQDEAGNSASEIRTIIVNEVVE
ncbi:MAG: DUF5011 domain-containing protein, partial [Candidatus Pacebacteria bacterium]|nr:DUF5011 domain-containing protein [Candidatus Paceibacterota bacterium]